MHGNLSLRTLLGLAWLAALGCSSSDPNRGDDTGGGSGGTAASAGSGAAANAGSGGSGAGGSGATSGAGGSAASGGFGNVSGNAGSGGNPSCASESASARLQPVYLAFAFDVSGSMGQGDYEWHDRSLKWDPVVAATKAFFADPTTAGISASLVFFPAADDRCEVDMYAEPSVPMTALPSPDFAAAIDAITPQQESDWRGGTPTLQVVQGTIGYLEPLLSADAGAVYAIVLVTDGYPQSCSDQGNTIDNVESEVAAVADRIPTYVIGVKNPPIDGAPDTVSDLDRVAAAGGTETAFIIETGDPTETAARFTSVINGIRQSAVSCSVEIPAPPAGQVFDPMRVNVNYTTGGGVSTPLGYDESCSADDTWRYDDAANPSAIVLCDATCSAVQADPGAQLNVEFGCMTRKPE